MTEQQNITNRSISILHPSRSRVSQARETINNWLSKADNVDNIEYILSVDESDPQLSNYKELIWCVNILLTEDNHTAIDAINNAAKIASGEIFVVVSDDFDAALHWDTLLLEALEGKEDFVVKTQDGIQPFIITLPIIDRKYYERFGYVYFPEYFHMFCDTEMTAVGAMLDRVITLPIEFKHNHYTKGLSPKDAINIKNDKTWKQGEDLYRRRCVSNFDLKPEQIVKQMPKLLKLK